MPAAAPPAIQKRPPKRSLDRRQSIVQAATALFAKIGFKDCEMQRVASRLRIAKGTLYLYFTSKEELFSACVDWEMQQMQAALTAATDGVTEPFDRIAKAILAYLTFFDEHPDYVELLIQERAIFRGRKRPRYFEYRDANRGPWREMYVELIRTGRVRGDIPVERILDTIGSLLYGTMFTNYFIGRSISMADQFTAIFEIIMRGILTDNERAVVRSRILQRRQ
jgi:AcrR family transcriptional regulator